MAINRTSPKKGKVVDIPDVPTIGTVTTISGGASVPFTASSSGKGGAATSYTVISTPGSITGTATSSPITVNGLTLGTSYTFKVYGNNATGAGEQSSASNSITAIAVAPTSVDVLLVAGGGGGNSDLSGGGYGGGGGAGGYRYLTAQSVTGGTGYTVTVPAGGAGINTGGGASGRGSDAVFGSLQSTGGGSGGGPNNNAAAGGSGGGARSQTNNLTPGTGNLGGYTPAEGTNGSGTTGGGATAAPTGATNSITGTSVTYATGGLGGNRTDSAGAANTGDGAYGGNSGSGKTGGSGVVIIRYPDTSADLASIGAGLTYTRTVTGGYKIYKFTAGTGTVTI